MKDYFIQLGLPIITAFIAYLTATYQSKNELKKQIELNRTELQKVREQCTNEIEKIKVQIDKQAELYEKNAETDLKSKFVENVLDDPTEMLDKFDSLVKLVDKAQQLQSNVSNKSVMGKRKGKQRY